MYVIWDTITRGESYCNFKSWHCDAGNKERSIKLTTKFTETQVIKNVKMFFNAIDGNITPVFTPI